MKQIVLSLVVMSGLFAISCNSSKKSTEEAKTTTDSVAFGSVATDSVAANTVVADSVAL